MLAQSMRTLLVGSGGGACQGKLARRRGILPIVLRTDRELEVGGSRSRSRIPKSLDCMSAVQRWHKQGSVNERETDFTTNSLAAVGGGGGTPAEQFSMDAITCRNERHTEKHRERRLHFLLTIPGRT